MEKWLVEVEEAMLSNVRKVISDSVKDYTLTPRKKWVISWPGQVAICVSSIYWTLEVSEAMNTPGGMDVCIIMIIINTVFNLYSFFRQLKTKSFIALCR